MRFNYAKEGTIVLDKITGLYYRVCDVDAEAGVATAQFYNPEMDAIVMDLDPICITKDNCLAFRAVYIPKDTSIPTDYTINNGILEKSGKKVEQGEIVVKNIIGCLPGKLVIEIQVPNSDLVSIATYEPDRDRFKVYFKDIQPVDVVSSTDSYVFFISRITCKKNIVNPESGKEEIVEIPGGTRLFRVTAEEVTMDSSLYLLIDEIQTLPVDGNSNALVLKGIYKDAQNDDNTENGKMTYVLCDCEPTKDFTCKELGTLDEDKLVSVSVVRIGEQGIFIKGKDFVKYGNIVIRSPKIAEIDAKYLIDVERTDTDIVFSLADQNYNITRIRSHKTPDRGFVVTIEK